MIPRPKVQRPTYHPVVVAAASDTVASTRAGRVGLIWALGTGEGGAGQEKSGEEADELHVC